MGHRLQRNLGPVTALTAGQWTDQTATGAPAVCCPKCARVSEIEFGVHVGGVVSQIWSCDFADCPYQDYLTLEAYGEEVAR
jgi:hypothetical protein